MFCLDIWPDMRKGDSETKHFEMRLHDCRQRLLPNDKNPVFESGQRYSNSTLFEFYMEKV
jgi:hypothetical protein